MNTATTDIRTKTRRVKKHILERYLKLADKVDKAEEEKKPLLEVLDVIEFKTYNELTEVFAKTVLPRSQEITGDDGTPLTIQISESIAKKNNINADESNTTH